MTVSPHTPDPERAEALASARSRASYAWDQIRLGEWQRWHTFTDADNRRDVAQRVRVAAHGYAGRHGMQSESRTEPDGVYLRFTRKS